MSRLILGACACLALSVQLPAQEPHRLDERQRSQILGLIKAVDAARRDGTAISAPDGAWSMHMLKSAAGMNYVPMSLTMSVPGAEGAVGVYVRVATKAPSASVGSSALERWLVTEAIKSSPRPAPYRGFVAVNPEEMPVGLTSSSRRQSISGPGASTTALALYERQLLGAEEARRKAEREAAERKEKGQDAVRLDEFVYPFEDFGFTARRADRTSGETLVERALAVPPGEYDLYVAASSAGGPATIYHSALSVPSYDGEALMLSSLILAEGLETLQNPYPAEEQSSHPYALGWTQVVPARDSVFTDAEELGVVFQVLNPQPDASRKPDVTVEYAFHPEDRPGDALTARHDFNARTLPEEFDPGKGHQVFAAQAVPLKSFAPGRYRLSVTVTDNVARRTVARDLDVSIRASARSPWLAKTVDGLLAPPFKRDRVLAPDAVAAALDALAAATPLSPEQSKALGEARAGRYATVLGAIPAGTDLASSFLRGLSMMALGENLEPAANQFREAIRFGSDFMPAAVYLGACFAAGGRDREAMAAWQLVGATDAASPLTNELLADAMMRTDRHQAALEMLMEAHDRWPDEAGLSRRLAAAQIETGQRDEALATLDALVAKKPDDLEGLFLAMYLVAGEATKEDAASAGGQKLARYARAYLDAQGPYRAIVEQWVDEAKVPD